MGLLVSGIAIGVLVTVIDIGETARILAQTNLWFVAATMLLVPAQVLLRTLRWRLLLPPGPDGERPAVGRVMPVLLAGYLGNLILPARLGEPARAYLLARRERIGFAPVLGSVLLERVIDLGSLALVGVWAAVQSGAPEWLVRGMAIVAGIGLALIVAAGGIGHLALGQAGGSNAGHPGRSAARRHRRRQWPSARAPTAAAGARWPARWC